MKLNRQAFAGIGLAASVAAFFMYPHEGTKFRSYQDGIGIWTICRGHTKGVKPNETATLAQCDKWYADDITDAQRAYHRFVQKTYPANVEAAAISFIFNAGAGNFSKSTLRKKLNEGDLIGACNEFTRWKYAGGKDCTIRSNNCYGLIVRRQQEKELCLEQNDILRDSLAYFDLDSSVRTAQPAR